MTQIILTPGVQYLVLSDEGDLLYVALDLESARDYVETVTNLGWYRSVSIVTVRVNN